MGVVALVVTSLASPAMLPKSFKEAKFYPAIMLTADALKHLAPRAGAAATTMARGAAAAGEGLAQSRAGDISNSLDSSVDGKQTKAQKAPAWDDEPKDDTPSKTERTK